MWRASYSQAHRIKNKEIRKEISIKAKDKVFEGEALRFRGQEKSLDEAKGKKRKAGCFKVKDKPRMAKRVYDAAVSIRPRFPKVFAFVCKYLPGAIKLGTDDLLAETLERAASGRTREGKPIQDYWAYCERAYEQKRMDRGARESEAEAAQYKLDLKDTPQSIKDVMKGMLK